MAKKSIKSLALALRLGRTLSEMRQTMTASELMMWIEYDKLSPSVMLVEIFKRRRSSVQYMALRG